MNTINQPPVASVAQRLAGKPLATALLAQILPALTALPRAPKLVVVRVGDNPASALYVGRKLAACAQVGIVAEEVKVHATETEANVHSLLHGLAHDDNVDAVLVQLPLPQGWQAQAMLDMVPASKDCDGLCSANIAGRRAGLATAILPATPLGVLRLLASIDQPLKDTPVAVIGKGVVVGEPLREMLTQRGAKVIGIERDTPHPQALTRQAQVVISAAGVPHLVNETWLQDGAVVIDVGLSRMMDNGKPKLVGDVNPEAARPVARYLTPVPGGVGPLTVASLLTNIVDCAYAQAGLPFAKWDIPLHP